MDEHITLYTETFNLLKKGIVKGIKNDLILSYEDDLYYNYSIELITEKLYNEKPKFDIEESCYLDLLAKFKDRKHNFSKNPLRVISRLLYPNFIKREDNEITFDEFIIQLAHREVYQEVIHLLKLNRELILRQFRLKKLDGYQNMEDFELIEYPCHTTNTDIYYEVDEFYKTLTEPKVKTVQFVAESGLENRISVPIYIDDNIDAIINENYFKIKEGFKYKIAHANFYRYLSKEGIINNDKTTLLDFIKVLYLNPLYHRSIIHFSSSTQLTSHFLTSLIEVISSDLKKAHIEKSQAFYSFKGTPIKADTISHSISETKNDYEINLELVRCISKYLDSMPV
ncbi:hypothetical protein [Psychroserpens burtonensis]|uniref:hypothetical protein n=1 Tax=Psychroserpens burtonensis TaxID=49278 RepID=UPI000419DB31|nr:hypothetical protein [Psychroserpens burtonensis]